MHFEPILGPMALCQLMRVEKCPFSAKIADLQKFRLRNFGRGVRSGRKNFFELQIPGISYCHQKIFHGRTKILSSSPKNPGGGKGRSPPLNIFYPDLARFALGWDCYSRPHLRKMWLNHILQNVPTQVFFNKQVASPSRKSPETRFF